MITVATVYAPRPRHPQWKDYLKLIDLQRQSVEHFGYKHLVVTDSPASVEGRKYIGAALSDSLMHAQLEGQVAVICEWDDTYPLVLVDADVLIARKLEEVFDGTFDVGLTSRIEPVAPVNNGVIYLSPGSRLRALRFWEVALSLCKPHWGGDQEAISKAAAPVELEGVHDRHGVRVRFFPMPTHNMTPGVSGKAGTGAPFAVHFKGDRKIQMQSYFEDYIRHGHR